MKIHVVRHGEAGDDIADSYGGAADFRLTDNGREGAHAAARALAGLSVEAVFSSPLSRLRPLRSSQRNWAGFRSPLSLSLRERNSYGVLSGVPKDRAKELFGYILDELKEKPGYSREPLLGAEDFDRFVERVRAGFQLVTDESEAKNYDEIVIVSHGKFTQALADFVFRFGDSVSIDLSAILSVDYTASQSVLV